MGYTNEILRVSGQQCDIFKTGEEGRWKGVRTAGWRYPRKRDTCSITSVASGKGRTDVAVGYRVNAAAESWEHHDQ